MARIIGNADDFYRLRVIRVDESDELDLDWRDDILYRRSPQQCVGECELYRVEAVLVDAEEDVTPLGTFGSRDEAYAFVQSAEDGLLVMTKSAFEDTYFTRD
ncbi:MAG: hypothetical protein U1F44_01345 [Coriobacteriia bacterium]|nr:hypothetical protein [Coriobacteriia bacterium]